MNANEQVMNLGARSCEAVLTQVFMTPKSLHPLDVFFVETVDIDPHFHIRLVSKKENRTKLRYLVPPIIHVKTKK